MKIPKPYLGDIARFVPLMTAEQICRAYFNCNWVKTLRQLRKDADSGLVSLSTEFTRGRVLSGSALASVQCGEPNPHPGHVAYLASQLWSETMTPQLIVRGTMKLNTIFGGEPQTIATASISHECALAEVFLSKRMQDPTFEWTLVQARPGGGVLPDAVTATGMIEVVGRYNGDSVAGKLSLSATANLELW